jgi:hypothetical protein
MLGSKLALVRNGNIQEKNHAHPFVPEVEKIKKIAWNKTKKISYVIIFITMRFFIKSSNAIKTKGKEIKDNIKNKLNIKENAALSENTEKREASKYLKIISEYRHTVRKIKHLIKEEEGIK